MTTAVELMDEADGLLHEVEAGAAQAVAANRIVRATDRLVKMVDAYEKEFGDLPQEYDLTWVDHLDEVVYRTSPQAVEAVMDRIDKMVAAAEVVGLSPGELARAEGLQARYAELGKRKRGPAFASGARNLGVPLTVECACGEFTANSTYGDWSSIRYAARKHGKVCAVANPGLTDALTNDLDRVRESVVKSRVSTRSGGLTFKVDGADPEGDE